jgi:hypothetical protein
LTNSIESPGDEIHQKQEMGPMLRELSKDEMLHLRRINSNIKFCPSNPKVKNSKSWHRFEKYKQASTMEEYFALGGNVLDFKYDCARGFVVIEAGDDAFEGFVAPVSSERVCNKGKNARHTQEAEFDEKPRRKRMRGVSARPTGRQSFLGSISPQTASLIELCSPSFTDLRDRLMLVALCLCFNDVLFLFGLFSCFSFV